MRYILLLTIFLSTSASVTSVYYPDYYYYHFSYSDFWNSWFNRPTYNYPVTPAPSPEELQQKIGFIPDQDNQNNNFMTATSTSEGLHQDNGIIRDQENENNNSMTEELHQEYRIIMDQENKDNNPTTTTPSSEELHQDNGVIIDQENNNNNPTTDTPSPEDLDQEYKNHNWKFTVAIYKEMVERYKLQNSQHTAFVISPWAVQNVLGLLNEGAAGNTFNEISTMFTDHYDKAKFREESSTFLDSIRSTNKSDMMVWHISKIYGGQYVTIDEDIKSISNTYHTDMENVDFNTPIESIRQNINKWIKDNANNMVTDVIHTSHLYEVFNILIVTVLSIKCTWSKAFPSKLTTDGLFYIYHDNEEAVNIATMKTTDFFLHAYNEALDLQFLKLVCDDDEYSLIIMLPNERTKPLKETEANIEEILRTQSYSLKSANVEIPKFEIESYIDFIPFLQRLGVSQMFNKNAEFNKMFIQTQGQDLFVNKVLQKLNIGITETGMDREELRLGLVKDTDPAPAEGLPEEPEINFVANHPFIFAFTHHDVMLFVGRYDVKELIS